jgi:hypothetical protein
MEANKLSRESTWFHHIPPLQYPRTFIAKSLLLPRVAQLLDVVALMLGIVASGVTPAFQTQC